MADSHKRGHIAPPQLILECMAAVNGADRADWHARLDLLRDWRTREYNPQDHPDVKEVVNRHAGWDDLPEAEDPPHFEELAFWLLENQRDQHLFRCLECRRWFVAATAKADRCGSAKCKADANAARQRAFRKNLYLKK